MRAVIGWFDRNLARMSGLWTFVAPIVPGTIGGVAIGYLSSGVSWLGKWGLFGWVIVGLGSALLVSLAYCLAGLGRKSWILGRRYSEMMDKGGVNPLEERFERKTIRLIDFYDPSYVSHKNKDIRNCYITGPGMVFFKNASIIGCEFKHVQIVIVADNRTMWGMTFLENANIVACKIINITMVMNAATYDHLDQNVREHVPVINGHYP